MTARRILLLSVLGLVVLSSPAFAQAPEPPPPPQPHPVGLFEDTGVLVAQTPDGNFRWWLAGRMMLDTAYYMNSDNQLANGVKLRKARMGLNTVFWKNWASTFNVDVADGVLDVKDTWIGYTGLKNSTIRVGNFKEPFGLEVLTSSRYITFMERSLLENFAPSRHVGLAVYHSRERWQTAGGVFGPVLSETVDPAGQDQAFSATGRFSAVPVRRGISLVHLGVAASVLQPRAATQADLSDADLWRVRARPETAVSQGRFLDTGNIPEVGHAALVGLEAAAVLGSWSVQAEYNHERITRTRASLPEPRLHGSYVFVSWFPTGEHRPYEARTAEFGQVLPKGPRGALELVARYTVADFNDPEAAVFGGKEQITTVGMNYYFNPNFRLMANYLFVVNDEHAKGDRNYKTGDKFNAFQARFQLNF
jgi:phosphate-selective porin OprO/OprP